MNATSFTWRSTLAEEALVRYFSRKFRNTDKEPAEKVVVKRMLEMQDEEDTKRFIKEVRIMKELKHPNIVEFRRVCFAPCRS